MMKRFVMLLIVGLILTFNGKVSAYWIISPIDITDSSLPHTADSVIYNWYNYYAPSNVSNKLTGLYNGSWHSGDDRTGQLFPHWVQIDFGTPRDVKQFDILSFSEYSESGLRLKDFRIEGSNDGVTYTILREAQYANRHEWQSFYIEISGYRYYRLVGLNNWQDTLDYFVNQMIIEEWRMFEGTFHEEPIRVMGDSIDYYWSLQIAYDNANDGAVIQAKSGAFSEDVYIDDLSNKSVTLQGGYNNNFSGISGMTSISGNLIVSNGLIVIENVQVQ